jgi:hypothetical protein
VFERASAGEQVINRTGSILSDRGLTASRVFINVGEL